MKKNPFDDTVGLCGTRHVDQTLIRIVVIIPDSRLQPVRLPFYVVGAVDRVKKLDAASAHSHIYDTYFHLRFGVQLEALYSMRSLSNDVETIRMNCFEIPVLFQWYFVPTFAVEVGPTFTGAFSASPKEFIYDGYYGTEIYHMDKVKAYDIMLSIGVNCKLKNGFTADLRYNMGNSDIAGNLQTKVSTISLGIGWLFSVIK